MLLSIILPCYNGADTIATQLDALANQCWFEPWEVIVVNNRSTDRSMTIVESYMDQVPNLRIVNAPARQGRSYARNVGVRAAIAEALLFCDADDEVGEGWLVAMGEALAKHDFVACRMDFEKLNSPSLAKLFSVHPQRKELMKTPFPPYLYMANGATLGVKRSLHEVIGGFDESWKRSQDSDYCCRLQGIGVKMHFVPNAVVHYRCRDKLSALFPQSYNWAQYTVLLYKQYRSSEGASDWWKRYAWSNYAREWLKIIKDWRGVFSEEDRVRLTWRVAWQLGLLVGSIKHRVPPVGW